MIIATAGHVDHGKTSLIKALTGVNTDRLKEEQQRGLTIVLGYAYYPLTDDKKLSIVDVPGHERFISTMVQGVSQVHGVLLVVALDEGIKPQTKDHIEIIELLGIHSGIVVVTKIDRVSEHQKTEKIAHILQQFEGSCVQRWPLVSVSSKTGAGLDQLREKLLDLAQKVNIKAYGDYFRFAIDRAFLVKGEGVVATGTVVSGQCAINDRVQTSPLSQELRVRGLQFDQQPIKKIIAPMRGAIKLAGVELSKLKQNHHLIAAKINNPSRCIAVKLNFLTRLPKPLIKPSTQLHVYGVGQHSQGRIRYIQSEPLLAYLILDMTMIVCFADRLIIRDSANQHSLMGATVIKPGALGRLHLEPSVIHYQNVDAQGVVRSLLKHCAMGVELDALSTELNMTVEHIMQIVHSPSTVSIYENNTLKRVLSREHWQHFCDRMMQCLTEYHRQHPEKPGLTLAALKRRLGSYNRDFLTATLHTLTQQQPIIYQSGCLMLENFCQQIPYDQSLWLKLEQLLAQAKTPTVHELAQAAHCPLKKVRRTLEGVSKYHKVVKITDNRYILSQQLKKYQEDMEHLVACSLNQGFTVAQFKDYVGIGRNFAIEILEYMDQQRLTQRMGNNRFLRSHHLIKGSIN